jgi:hypothetical protein
MPKSGGVEGFDDEFLNAIKKRVNPDFTKKRFHLDGTGFRVESMIFRV